MESVPLDSSVVFWGIFAMRQGIVSVLIIAAICGGCTKKSSKQTGNPAASQQAETQKVQPAQVPPSAPKALGCESGAAPNVISGNCQGKWSLVNGASGQVCEYVWGPAVQCPAGTKALGNDTVCYGVTGRPVEGEKLKSAEGCAQKFGAQPISPKYTLSCCAL